MTYSKKTLVKRKEYSRLWRVRNKAHTRAYDKARYEKKKVLRRERWFGDRRCMECGIPLKTPVYGACGTRVYCVSCSPIKRKYLLV